MEKIYICVGPRCRLNFSEALVRKAEKLGAPLEKIDCLSHCDYGPNVLWKGTVYNEMTGSKLETLINPNL